MTILFVFVVLGGVLVAIRVLPTDTNKWHTDINADQSKDMAGASIRVIPGSLEVFEKLDQIARATPRTKTIAGDVKAGRITYVTRSKWVGFPDYTTVELQKDTIKMFARLRFGQYDFGVNRARLEDWLGQLTS